jgi:hypothetical protein
MEDVDPAVDREAVPTVEIDKGRFIRGLIELRQDGADIEHTITVTRLGDGPPVVVSPGAWRC